MLEVQIDRIPLDRLASLLEPERAARLEEHAAQARKLLEGRIVWNVNATATGGGVAEMLQALLAYGRGAGVDTRWLVLHGSPAFFALTKRIHNLLHGSPGDGGPLGPAERELFDAVLAENLEALLAWVGPRDIVLLHDPQTAGLVEGLRRAGIAVIWRCHVGRDTGNDLTERAWDFLRPDVERADAVVFSRAVYAPSWVEPERLKVIPPSLDPFSTKNAYLTPVQVSAVLSRAGVVDTPVDDDSLGFVRRDGSCGQVRRHRGLIVGDGMVPADARVVLQVSRWDRLKDMSGVLAGFARHLSDFDEDVHLMLVGPEVSGVSDDPEGAQVLAECRDLWESSPAEVRNRVHLCSVPMDDGDENAHIINALQRHASVVVQKSLVEGFGLTVTEPMWKERPVLASRVGGIQDQIVDGVSGILLDDPEDLDVFASKLAELLAAGEYAVDLGTAAHERVRDRYLGDRHLIQYVELFDQVLDGR